MLVSDQCATVKDIPGARLAAQLKAGSATGWYVMTFQMVGRNWVITVGLDVRDIQVYQHEQVAQASPEALIAAVVG